VRTLVLGGARSGKSAFAESLVTGPGPVRYVATARPGDAEMAARIRRHRARRPPAWEVVEVDRDLAGAIAATPAGHRLLIDGLTLWLATVLEGPPDPKADIDGVVERLGSVPEAVVVSEEVGGGIVPANALARRFRDAAGELNQRLAALCERVFLVTAGIPMEIKRAGAARAGGAS
jgi:adenosylcobinamide kinase/adenosylcobinamide-phosphate guanylyltransferase